MLIHAALDAEGHPFAILAGESFVTYRMRITSDDDAAHFEAAIGDVIPVERFHGGDVLRSYSDEDLDRYLIQALSFAGPASGQEVADWGLAVGDAGEISAAPTFDAPLPEEVPMWKVRGWLAREGKLDLVNTVLGTLPNANEAREVFASAPNLVVAGGMALLVQLALSYNATQYADAIRAMAAYEA